jgi:hypothetical protein
MAGGQQPQPQTTPPTSNTNVNQNVNTSGSLSRAAAKAKAKAQAAAASQSTSGAIVNSSPSQNVANDNKNAANNTATQTNGNSAANSNDQDIHQADNSVHRSNTVALAQGSWVAPDCGSGGNAGGGDSHAAGFLGIYWTPAECKLMKIAYIWANIGMMQEACKTTSAIGSLRDAYKKSGLALPDCTVIDAITKEQVAKAIDTPVSTDNYATKDDIKNLATKEDLSRAFTKSQAK